MEKEILELIKTNENNLMRYIKKRDDLRNKIRFCFEHKFEEEIRICDSELKHFEGIVYDYESFIRDLKIIVGSIQTELLENCFLVKQDYNNLKQGEIYKECFSTDGKNTRYYTKGQGDLVFGDFNKHPKIFERLSDENAC